MSLLFKKQWLLILELNVFQIQKTQTFDNKSEVKMTLLQLTNCKLSSERKKKHFYNVGCCLFVTNNKIIEKFNDQKK